ncbi:MAG: IS110 family transposase [Puniceicoccales bacterium]|jgi:transposase|nr:IS110 family transposase [Puniceicoccales bacterium]
MSVPDSTYIGIDVAKLKFDFFVSREQRGVFSNDPAGIVDFVKFCKTFDAPCVVAEATGGYEKAVLNALFAAGIMCFQINPKKVKAFAQSEGINAKTDPIDAKLLRDFALSKCSNPESCRKLLPYKKPDPAVQKLRSLCEVRTGLKTMQAHVAAQSEIPDAFKKSYLKRQKAFVEKELAKVEKDIAGHIGENESLRLKNERMQTVKGVGVTLSATLLAYAPELGSIENKVLCGLIGVAPYAKDSGAKEGKRRPRRGRQQIKKVLYMAAVSASQHNPILKAFSQRLRDRGKPSMVTLVAVMRKLLCLLNNLIANPDFSLA